MKKIVLTTVAILLSANVFSQSNILPFQYDPMLLEVLSSEEIALYEQNAPGKLWDINFELTHAGYVDSKLPETYIMMNSICNYVGTGKSCNVAEIIASKKFNIYNFGLTSDPQKYVVYPIDNTGFYIILIPTDELARQKSEGRKKMGF